VERPRPCYLRRLLGSAIDALFDPVWNATHRVTIWAVITVSLFLSGIGVPFPEDIPLMASGFTTYKQAGDEVILWRYVLTFTVVTIAILAGDLCAYALGRRYGVAIRARFRFTSRLMSRKRLVRVMRWYREYGSFTVFLGRQVAGLRFVTFYMAGSMKMNLAKFVLWDFIGCLVSVPIWLALGTLAASYGRDWAKAASSKVGLGFLGIVLILACGLVLYDRRRKRQRQQPPDSVSSRA
jgi:membrane protein DedA with SNARE-associated domain